MAEPRPDAPATAGSDEPTARDEPTAPVDHASATEEAIEDDAVTLAPRTGIKAFVALGRERVDSGRERANELYERYKHRPLVDVGLRLYFRDREAAGTVVGSAIAFRLFLFFVPMILFLVGLVGFFADIISADQVRETGVTGTLAQQIDTALNQPNSTRWVATFLGLIGMASTGRTLSRALAQASCLAWRLPMRPKASVRLIGAVVGLIIGLGVVSAGIGRIHDDLGLGLAGVSFIAVIAIYSVGWLLLTWMLPRPTPDPGVLLPGALVVGVTLAGLQAVSQLYLPGRFDRASELYGAIGITLVTLGWFFIAGRAIVLAMALNAVLYERFGSISSVVFGLPVVRILPRKWAWLRHRFGLPEPEVDAGAEP